MDNTFTIKDLPDDAECSISITSSASSGVWTVKLIRNSPFRQLLEAQESYQESFVHNP